MSLTGTDGTTSHEKLVVITSDPESGYVAKIPEWPGCLSQGDTIEDAARNILEAHAAYKESLIAHGELQAETANRIDVFLFWIGD